MFSLWRRKGLVILNNYNEYVISNFGNVLNTAVEYKELTNKLLFFQKRCIFQNTLLNSTSATSTKSMDHTDNSKFTKIGKDTTVLGKLMQDVKSTKRREKTKRILLEGKRLIADSLAAGAEPIVIFFSREKDLEKLKISPETPVLKVLYKNLQLWSDVTTCQGIMGVFVMPEDEQFGGDELNQVPLTIVCDNVRDPGNMGSILRTSAAVGCSQLYLTKGCVDVWDPKVLRTGSGAHFRLRIKRDMIWKDLASAIDERNLILIASGSESSDENESEAGNVHFNSAIQSSLPLVPYTTNYMTTHSGVTVIIGGETEGVSEDAFRFTESRVGFGQRVYIPLANGVESLNSGTALGIISYEIRRQLTSRVSSDTEQEKYQVVGVYSE